MTVISSTARNVAQEKIEDRCKELYLAWGERDNGSLQSEFLHGAIKGVFFRCIRNKWSCYKVRTIRRAYMERFVWI